LRRRQLDRTRLQNTQTFFFFLLASVASPPIPSTITMARRLTVAALVLAVMFHVSSIDSAADAANGTDA
jgi:hypothetical protein